MAAATALSWFSAPATRDKINQAFIIIWDGGDSNYMCSAWAIPGGLSWPILQPEPEFCLEVSDP